MTEADTELTFAEALARLPQAPPADPTPQKAYDVGATTHVAIGGDGMAIDQIWQNNETGAMVRVVCCLTKIVRHGLIVMNGKTLEAWEPRGFLQMHTFIGTAKITLPLVRAAGEVSP